MLYEKTLFDTFDKVAIATQILKDLEPKEGYYIANSGGKDSCVIVELVKLSKVKADYHHSLTTIDPPELIYFLRNYHPETIIHRPSIPFLERLIVKGFPLRQARWCCEEYKERGGVGRFVITGVRKSESYNRSKRKRIEFCLKNNGKRLLNLIIDWSNQDVWQFIKERNIPYCELYNQGFSRIGCLLCPMAGKHRLVEADRYPIFVNNFKRAFVQLFNRLKSLDRKSVRRWQNGIDMFNWWLSENKEKHDSSQIVLFP